MKKIYILPFFLFLSGIIQCQTVEWVRQTGGSDMDLSWSIRHDSQGNVFVGGSFRGSVSFDPNSNDYDFTAQEYGDAYLQKYDAQGNFLWAQVYSSLEFSEAIKLVIDEEDNVYIMGQFLGSIDLDPGPGTDIHTTPNTDFNNSYIVKLDNDGHYIWGHSFEINSPIQSVDILAIGINNDEIFLTGTFNHTLDLDFGNGEHLLTADGEDGFFMKIDTDGNFIWAHMLGGHLKEINPVKVIFDNNNNIIIGGNYKGLDLDLNWDAGEDIHSSGSPNNKDPFILKVSLEGTFLWAMSAKGCPPNSVGICNDDLRSMETDSNNDIYFTGAYDYYINFEPDTTDFILDTGVEPCTISPCFGYSRAYIAKISSEGQMIWAKDFEGDNQTINVPTFQETWNLVRSNDNGQIFFVLSVYGTIDIEVNGNTISHTGTDDHMFMTFLNVNPQDGSVNNTFFISSTLNVTLYDMEATNSRLYIAGRFWEETYFDPTHPLTPSFVDGYTLLIKDNLMDVDEFIVSGNLFTIFPNPVEENVILKANTSVRIKKVMLRDIFGRIIKQFERPTDFYEAEVKLNISDLSSGYYLVEIFTDNSQQLSYKLLKK